MMSWKRCAALMATAAMICTAVGLIIASAAMARGSDDYYGEDNANQATDQQSQQNDGEKGQQDQTPAQEENQPVSLQGTGRQVSSRFMLQPGLSVFEVTHDGESNLIVRLLDGKGDEIDTVFNQIGTFSGDRGFAISRGGECLLDVIADGNWTVAIRQPRPEQGEKLPTTLSGVGQHSTPFLELAKGLTTFKLKHDGEARFRVTLMDENGQTIESLINTLGAFDGSKPVKIENPGIYFLNVSADGDWTIEVE